MSEKRVNIKITASTNDFNNAIKKAQKEIDGLADAISDLSSSKFGSELEKQISNLSQEIKTLESQLDSLSDTLGKLGKADFGQIDKAFKDISDSSDKVNKGLSDVKETLNKVDQADLGGLDKSFLKVESTVDNLSKEIGNATDKMKKDFSNLSDGADKFNKSIGNIDMTPRNNMFEGMVKDILKADDAVDNLAKSFKNLDGTFDFSKIMKFTNNDLTAAKQIMDDLVENGGDLKKVLEKIDADGLQGYKDSFYGKGYKSKDSWSDSSNKKNTNSIVEGLVSGTVAAKAMEHSIGGVADVMREATEGIREMPNSLQDTIRYFHDLNQEVASNKNRLDELNKEYTELTKKQDDLTKSKEGLKNSNDMTNRAMELAEKHMYEYAERAKELDKALEDAYKTGKTDEEIEKMTKEFQEATKWAEKFQDVLTMIRKIDIDEAIDLGLIDEEFREASEAAKELEKQIKDTKKAIADKNKEAQGFADDFEKEYKAYQSLSKAVKAYLEDEEKSVLQREKVAKSFRELSSEMEKVYADSKKFSNAKLIDDTLKEASEYIDKLDLSSTKNLQRDLERLGELIDDKAKKIKRFKELSSEFGSEDGRKAFGLEKQSEQLRDYARNTDFVIEAVNELNKAFAKVKVGDDDNLRIRGRIELLENYGKTLAKTAADIRNKYHDIEKAEDVYNAATPQERAELDKYEAWQKNRKEIEKYTKAIEEYRAAIKDMGGQVDSRFLDEFGKFDARKFIEDFDKMGTSSAVLQKQMNAVKSELLENIKAEKENAEAMRQNAKAAADAAKTKLDQAKADNEAAQAAERHSRELMKMSSNTEDAAKATKQYEADSKKLAETMEKVAKAEQEYKDAKDNSDNYDKKRLERAQQLIKAYNEQAEAMRKMGLAAKDLGREDIEKFDKSLASLLDDAGVFGDDLPKNFADFREDIKALFADMDGFDFGGVWDGIKGIGAGLLAKLPTELKIATAAALALGAALKKCAEVGINQFGRGMDTIKGTLSKFTGLARDVGQEVRDAFENITGMHLDMSSLMEIPVQYEYIMAQVKGITGASEADFERLKEAARQWGGTTMYSATEVGEAMTYMGMAGWETQAVLDGIGGVLDAATIGCMDLGQASDFVTDGLTAMGLSAKKSNDFVDLLAGTIVNSNTGMSQLQKAYGNVGSLAGEHNVAISELNTALGLMANKGVKGAKAGTAMKNLFSFLAAPSDKSASIIKQYGLQEAQDMILKGDLLNGIKAIKAELNDLSPKEKDKVLSSVFGKEALPGMAALFSSTTDQIDELQFSIETSTKAGSEFAKSLGLIDKNGKMTAKTIGELKENNKDNYDKWVNFNNVLKATTDQMDAAGGTGDQLGAIIAKLGEDNKVTAENVSDVVTVFEKLGEGSNVVRDALEHVGSELKTTDEGALDITATIKDLAVKWDTLTDSQKQYFANQLGVSGSLEELDELFANNGEQIENLVDQYESATGAARTLAEAYENTLKGSLDNLASSMEERLLQVFDKVGKGIRDTVDEISEFFNIWNGMGISDENQQLGYTGGLDQALKYLEGVSQKWKDAITNGLSQAISSINDFVNSVSFDNLLQVGTNIIDGIANGIRNAAKSGTLDSAITTAINKIATWFSTNLDTIVEAGKLIMNSISKGISENSDEIGEAIKSVIEMQTSIDRVIAKEKWKLIGDNIVTFIVEGIQSKVSVFGSALEGFLSSGFGEAIGKMLSGNPIMFDAVSSWGLKIGEWLREKLLEAFDVDLDLSFGNILSKLKDKMFGTAYAEGPSGGATPLGGSSPIDIINQNLSSGKSTTDATAASIGEGISSNIVSKLETMDASQLQALNTELQNLQTTVQTVATGIGASFTAIQDSSRVSFMGLFNIINNQMTNVANSIRTQMVNCANIFRNQFLSMANVARNQMVNVSNIVRNQAQSWSNVIRNQVTNARNALTSQFLSMAAVARTQMVNISNIVRNQATAWANIIRNQGNNAKAALTSSFAGMAAAAASGMAKVLSTVRSYMSQVVAATNRTMTMNFKVNRSITTTNTVRTVAAPAAANAMYAANAASTYSLRSGDTSALASRASSAITSSSSKGAVSSNKNDGITLEIPVMLDGKELARGTAKYVDGELKMKQKRDDRKRGVK